jgi:hypothetical protein
VKEVASAVTGDEELEIETPLMEAGEFSKDSGLSGSHFLGRLVR